MYRTSMEPNIGSGSACEEPPPHRYLFQCYLYQYHLIHFTENLLELVGFLFIFLRRKLSEFHMTTA